MKCSKAITIAVLFTGLFATPSGAQSSGQNANNPSPAQVLVLPLKPEGFASRAVTVKAGFYLVDVVNRSTVRNLNVQIDRMPGTNLSDNSAGNVAGGQEEIHRSQFLGAAHLTPGTYRVSIAGHPRWVCAINVK